MSLVAAWREKTNFTFSDAIAVIRCEFFLPHSPLCQECNISPTRKFKRLLYALRFPAKCTRSSLEENPAFQTVNDLKNFSRAAFVDEVVGFLSTYHKGQI